MLRLSPVIDRLKPSGTALFATGFVTILVCLLANARTILDRSGLDDSSRYIGDSAGQHLLRFLSRLDSFRLTAGIVTFLLWALVGLICLGIIQTLFNIRNNLDEERTFTSSEYIHPAGFTSRHFHSEITGGIIRTVLTAAGCIGSVLLLLGCLVPLARLYQTPAIDTPGIVNIAFLLFGFILVWCGVLVVYSAGRLFALRNHLTRT